MRKGTTGQLGDCRLLQCGGELEFRKHGHRRLKGSVPVRLCWHKMYRTRRISFLLRICRPVAALLEAVDLWGVWGSSVPWVPFWRCCGVRYLGHIVLTMTEE